MTSAAKAAWPGEVLPSAGTPPHPDVSANSYIGNTIGCWGWDKAGWPRVGMIYLLSGGGSDRDFGAWKKFMPYSENWDKLLNFFLFQSLLKIRDKRCLAGLCFWDCTWKYISLAQLTVAKFSLNLISIIFLSFIYAIYFLAVMGLHCCPWAFSSYGEWGLFFVVLHRLLIAVDSSVVEHRLQGVQASAVVALGLSCSAACGIFPDQGWEPCTGRRILHHWTNREAPHLYYLLWCPEQNNSIFALTLLYEPLWRPGMSSHCFTKYC